MSIHQPMVKPFNAWVMEHESPLMFAKPLPKGGSQHIEHIEQTCLMTCTFHCIRYGFGRNIMSLSCMYIQHCTKHDGIITNKSDHNKC